MLTVENYGRIPRAQRDGLFSRPCMPEVAVVRLFMLGGLCQEWLE